MDQSEERALLVKALDPAVDANERVAGVVRVLEHGQMDIAPVLDAWMAGGDSFLTSEAWMLRLGRLKDARFIDGAIAATWLEPRRDDDDEQTRGEDDDKEIIADGAACGLILYVLQTHREQDRIARAMVRSLLRAMQLKHSEFSVACACERCVQVVTMQALPSLPKGGTWSPKTIDWELLRPYLPEDAELLGFVPAHAQLGVSGRGEKQSSAKTDS